MASDAADRDPNMFTVLSARGFLPEEITPKPFDFTTYIPPGYKYAGSPAGGSLRKRRPPAGWQARQHPKQHPKARPPRLRACQMENAAVPSEEPRFLAGSSSMPSPRRWAGAQVVRIADKPKRLWTLPAGVQHPEFAEDCPADALGGTSRMPGRHVALPVACHTPRPEATA